MFGEFESKSSFRSLYELVRISAGRQLGPQEWLKMQLQRTKLEQDTFEIASRLEEAGIPAFDHSSDLTLVCPITGEVQKVQAYRNICFLPCVARKRRAPMLKRLQFFGQLPENQGKLRMWTFNTGLRVRIAELNDRIRQLNRNVGIIASELRERFSIDMIFRATELGGVEKREGIATLHPHAHVLIKTPYLQDWSKAISWVNARWRQLCELSPNSTWKPFEECGKLHNIHEACKYVCKPESLKELSPSDLAELYGALYKKHLVQPLGLFKRYCAEWTKKGLKPVRMGDKWKLVYNWNKRTDSETLARQCPDDEDAKRSIDEDYFGDEMEDRLYHEEDHKTDPPQNQIISILPPSFYFGNRCSPALLVNRMTESFNSEGCGSVSVIGSLKKAYEEGLGSQLAGARSFSPPIVLHNRSITSGEPKQVQPTPKLVATGPPI